MTSGPLVSPTELRRGSRTVSAAARTSENVESSGSSTRETLSGADFSALAVAESATLPSRTSDESDTRASHSNQLVDALGRGQAASKHQQVPVMATKQAGRAPRGGLASVGRVDRMGERNDPYGIVEAVLA